MTYRIVISDQYSGKRYIYGKPVDSIKEIHDQLIQLEIEWQTWNSQGHPPIAAAYVFQYLEGSEIYVISDNGLTYWLDENSGFQVIQ